MIGFAKLSEALFPPSEVRNTCDDIDAFLRADNGLCIDTVRSEATTMAKVTDKTLYSIRTMGYTSDQLAHILIHNVLTCNLQSGRQHVYRGMLSMVGNDMLRLWHINRKKMVKQGYSTQEEYDADVPGLMEDIRSVG